MSSTRRGQRQLQRLPRGSSQFLLIAAMTNTTAVADSRANTSGHSSALLGRLCRNTKFSPNADPASQREPGHLRGEPIRRYVLVRSASRLTSMTATRASTTPKRRRLPGPLPMATPTATGTAALSTAVSGETTEIGPAPSAA